MKLHLPAKVPNEGARLLAQWVLGLPDCLNDAARLLNTEPDRVQRMVAGQMVPGMEVGNRLCGASGIRFRDFQCPARYGWFEHAVAFARAA